MTDPVARLNAALENRYRIERALGEGGMATVYLADDLRHERRVALKVLKPELAAVIGAERFLAEIKTTASLQHPHILPLFDSGQADSFLFYVMPYVDGESLRERLDREHELPVDEAVRIGTQVAEALEHAHRHGIIHRDIKPANVLLHEGNTLVSDFGIALAFGGADRGRLTETGVTLGTPKYMSPEQATGDSNVGPGTDVWALGCVLYEMLVGEAPFGGSTPQAVLGQIVTGSAEPVTKRRSSTPAHVGAAIARAIEKVPSDRFTSAEGFARALGDPGFRHGEEPHRRRWLAGGAAAVVVYLLGILTWTTFGPDRAATEARAPVRLVVPGLGSISQVRSIALSNDGAYLAHGGGGALTVRRIVDSEIADTLEATNAMAPFFSPDGESVAYFGGLSVMQVPRSGGTSTTIAAMTGSRVRGGTWGDDGTIVWATTSGLYRGSADGGGVRLLATPDTASGELEYAWPEILPGSRTALFTLVPRGGQSDRDASIASIDLDSGEITVVLAGGSSPRYVAPGHLVYSANGRLHAVEFDPVSKRISGERVELPIEGLHIVDGWGTDFDISSDGTLAYLPASGRPSTLVWRDREGREEPLSAPPGRYGYRRISPDGTRIVYDKRLAGGGPTRDVYVWDLERGTEIRLTNNPGEEFFADWSPDGDWIYYSSNQGGVALNVYRRAANGAGGEELILAHSANHFLNDVTPDGQGITVAQPGGGGLLDLYMLSLQEPIRLDPLLVSPAHEYNGFVSPDGNFYVYQTDRDGQFEVWVSPLGESDDAPVKVSIDGGIDPGWSLTGDEVFYRSREGSMMAAPIVTTPRLEVGDVVELFEYAFGVRFGATGGRFWDVSPLDGRFLLGRLPPDRAAGIRVILYWEQELRRLTEP